MVALENSIREIPDLAEVFITKTSIDKTLLQSYSIHLRPFDDLVFFADLFKRKIDEETRISPEGNIITFQSKYTPIKQIKLVSQRGQFGLVREIIIFSNLMTLHIYSKQSSIKSSIRMRKATLDFYQNTCYIESDSEMTINHQVILKQLQKMYFALLEFFNLE